jgi:hypothetical protein
VPPGTVILANSIRNSPHGLCQGAHREVVSVVIAKSGCGQCMKQRGIRRAESKIWIRLPTPTPHRSVRRVGQASTPENYVTTPTNNSDAEGVMYAPHPLFPDGLQALAGGAALWPVPGPSRASGAPKMPRGRGRTRPLPLTICAAVLWRYPRARLTDPTAGSASWSSGCRTGATRPSRRCC